MPLAELLLLLLLRGLPSPLFSLLSSHKLKAGGRLCRLGVLREQLFPRFLQKFLEEKRRERKKKGGALVAPPAHLRGVDGDEKGKAAEPPLLHLLSAVLPVRTDHFR